MSLFSFSSFRPRESAVVSASAGAESQARSAQRDVRMLEENLSKTLMICEALWELISEKTKLTQDDLYKKLYEIDMRDGVLDGRNEVKILPCPGCGRKVAGRHATCLYCGQVLDKSVFQL